MTDESTRQRLKHAVANLDTLPAMPITAQKLLALPLETEEGEAQMLRLIEQDPQIAAKLISLANSPVMGVSRQVGSVHEAALLLGLSRVKSVSVGIASMSNFSRNTAGRYFKPQDLWLHSVTIAIVMRSIAQSMPRALRPGEDQIFLSGLLHDIGFMALHHLDSESSNTLHHQLCLQPQRPILDVELETLGITHCYIGSQLARHWHLPPDITAVIGYHHPPYDNEATEANPLVRLLSLAEKMLPDFGINEHTSGEITDEDWQRIGIDPADAGEISVMASEVAVQAAQMGDGF